jgi:spoIIIJ-associated protein
MIRLWSLLPGEKKDVNYSEVTNMVYEFDGRTEKEAIDKAVTELGMEKDEFDVEILETQRSGLFKKGYVKIQVHTDEGFQPKNEQRNRDISQKKHNPVKTSVTAGGSTNDWEEALISFLEGIIERMGYTGKVSVAYREENKLCLKIDSEYSSILIGKKGKNLDALQLLSNLYAGRLEGNDMRIILDSENYRVRREESLVRLAYNVADRVRESKTSILLEPMNPFDRRLIHTTLNDIADIETKSEGEGLYKQVRVYYRGRK